MNNQINISLIFGMLIGMTVLMTSCQSNEDEGGSVFAPVLCPISFRSGNAAMGTRAESEPRIALDDYIRDFTVYGICGKISGGTFTKGAGVVFPNYVVWYEEGISDEGTWEYVGTHPSISMPPTDERYSNFYTDAAKKDDIRSQVIKYWDKKQDAYYFWAIGKASKYSFVPDSYGRVAQVSTSVTRDDVMDDKNCLFYTDPTCIQKVDFEKPVDLVFHPYQSKIRIGFYEDIKWGDDKHRFTIRDLRFYVVDESNAGTFTSGLSYEVSLGGQFYSGANVTLNYGYENAIEPTLSVNTVHTGMPTCRLNMGRVAYEDQFSMSSATPVWAMLEGAESEFVKMMPGPLGRLSIKCDYIVVDTEGQIADTPVEGRVATVPEEYTNLQPGYQYTYVFKITEAEIKLDTDIRMEGEIQEWGTGEISNDKGTEGW